MPSSSLDRSDENDRLSRPARRRLRASVLVALVLVLGWDLTRDPAKQASAWVMLRGIDIYQQRLSRGVAKAGVRCRFEPTCSRYAAASIEREGALIGGWRSALRLIRCGPWTAAGTVDEP